MPLSWLLLSRWGLSLQPLLTGLLTPEVLLPDGASEHDYSLRPSDVKRLQGADLVVWIGPEMEAFMEKSVKNIPNAKQVTIAQLNDVKPLLMKGADDDDDDHGHNDAGSEKVTSITITAITTCIFGFPQR